MKIEQPYFSIIVPTRDRPNFLKLCLESIKKQSFQNFEVIISDNHTGNSSKDVVDSFSEKRFNYFTPPYPLPMHENWEYAYRQSSGKYVLFLIDKTILYPNALQIVYNISQKTSIDIITWWADSFFPLDENKSIDLGFFSPCPIPKMEPHKYCPKNEIIERFELSCPRGSEANHYYRGKICFGAYNKNLIEIIVNKINNIFYPISPDYTSMLAALSYADNAVDLGQPLLIQICSKLSNGRLCQIHPESAKKFLLEIDKTGEIIKSLPIPKIYSSSHNIVVYDYLEMQKIIGSDFPKVTINKRNLYFRAWNDITNIEEDKESQRLYLLDLFSEINRLEFIDKLFVYTLIYCEMNKKWVGKIKSQLKTMIILLYSSFPQTFKTKINIFVCKILKIDSWDKAKELIKFYGILSVLNFSMKRNENKGIYNIPTKPYLLSEILEKLGEDSSKK